MRFVRIEAGTYRMGQLETPLPSGLRPLYRGRGRYDNLRDGNFDEHPVHEVTITKPFYVGVFEVTNKQYELFDPQHRELRGKNELSTEDDEAVIYVNWYEAQAFCRWLADKEGLSYRLPSEAEWEYACRAGTTSHYHTGDALPASFQEKAGRFGGPRAVSLQVGQTPPNAWGLHDMHGNVEEWCRDWYGPYRTVPQSDPVGHARGDFRILRGGSHSTHPFFLRAANRMATLPEDKHWLIGFRVVLGAPPSGEPLRPSPPRLHQQAVVSRSRAEVSLGPDTKIPFFKGPRKYVRIPAAANGPVYALHNHDPAVVECPNGDLLAVWYTCAGESDRELAQAASRLRWGAEEWDTASPFWNVPDRNDHAPALWFDGKETIYHFTGLAFGAGHYSMALALRKSTDSGKTWEPARLIVTEYGKGRMPSEPVFRLQDGRIALTVDWRGSGLWYSADEGLTWTSPGGSIGGIHAGVVELRDGRLLAFGRGEGGQMPRSVSSDGGKTFTVTPSEFPAVGGGQRPVLIRLREGPLMLAAFADTGTLITDASGVNRTVYGLYTAVSEDEGATWPHRRLVTDDGPGRAVECTGGGLFCMSGRSGEYRGYLSVCQSADGLIHLISSREHYSFNLRWLVTPAPSLRSPPRAVRPVTETFTGPTFDADGWVDYKGYTGGFNGKGQFTIRSDTHLNGINRLVGAGSFEIEVALDNIRFFDRGERVSEGIVLRVKDARARWCAFAIKDNQLFLDLKDKETDHPVEGSRLKPGRGWLYEKTQVPLEKAPVSARVRLVWRAVERRMRIFYGLDGEPATRELPQSERGIHFGKSFGESTTLYVVTSNGTMDVDHVAVRALVEETTED